MPKIASIEKNAIFPIGEPIENGYKKSNSHVV